MKDKKNIKWATSLFDSLIKEFSDTIAKISDDREKDLREMINNCEEIKLFKFEENKKEDIKKKTK